MGSLTGAEAWVAPEVGASGRWDPSHARAVAPRDDRWWDGRMPSAPLPPPPSRTASGRAALGALALAGVLATAACGQDATRADDRHADASRPARATTPAPGGTASEVRLARVGGVAGFQDVLVVAPDGRVTGTTRAGAVDCTVPAGTVQVLATAAPPTTGLNAGNDRIATSVERDGTTFDLGEAQGTDPLSTTARALLDDVQLPEGRRTVCT